jgi:hypothetical protein
VHHLFLLPNVLQVSRNDGPQLEAVRCRLDQPVQHDRRGLVSWQPVTDICATLRRQDFDYPIGRQIRDCLSQSGGLSVATACQLIGPNPRSVLAGKDS